MSRFSKTYDRIIESNNRSFWTLLDSIVDLIIENQLNHDSHNVTAEIWKKWQTKRNNLSALTKFIQNFIDQK